MLHNYNVMDEFKNIPYMRVRDIQKSIRLPYAVCCLNLDGGGNVGAILRTSALMGAEMCIILGRRKYDRRSTVGAHNYIDVLRIDALNDDGHIDSNKVLQVIRDSEYVPVFVEQGGIPYRDFDLKQVQGKPCFVFGNEGIGIPKDLMLYGPTVSVTQYSVMRSLNVCAAAAIVIEHAANQLKSGE